MRINVTYDDVFVHPDGKTVTPSLSTVQYTHFSSLNECINALRDQVGTYTSDGFVPWHKIVKISEVKHV